MPTLNLQTATVSQLLLAQIRYECLAQRTTFEIIRKSAAEYASFISDEITRRATVQALLTRDSL